MARKTNVSGTTGTSLPGIQGPKGKTSRQTFYGSKNVKDSSIGILNILENGEPTGKFAYVPENTNPQKGDFVLYTEVGQNSYTLYSITLSTPDTLIGNFTCECAIIDKFLKSDEQKSESGEIDVTINVTPVTKTATIRKFGMLDSMKLIPNQAGNILRFPIKTAEENINLDMKMFNIYFQSDKSDLSDDIKFVLEFTDDYSSPRTYSSLIYRFGAYGQTKGGSKEHAMSEPTLTYRGVLDAYRNQTETSSHYVILPSIDGFLSNKVMNYTDPESGYIPDNYCIERLDNFSITVKDFNETIEKGKLFNKDVFIPAELLSNRRVCGNNQEDRSNYKIMLTAYVKKTSDICEKIFVSDFTDTLKNMMKIN